MASKIKVDQIQTADGTGTIALQNQLSGMTTTSMPSGTVLQQVRNKTTTKTTVSATIPEDATIPQNTEGAELFTLAITPTSSSSILVFDISIMYGAHSGNAYAFCTALFQDSNANALACRAHRHAEALHPQQNNFTHYMTAGTTSSTTFKVRVGMNSGTCYINRDGESTNHDWGGLVSSILITEYKA